MTSISHHEAVDRWLKRIGKNRLTVANEAGIPASTLYNLKKGKAKQLSTTTLGKLAQSQGVTIDAILSGGDPEGNVPLSFVIGSGGRMFSTVVEKSVSFPPGVAVGTELVAARVDGDGLRPLPSGWIVYFEKVGNNPLACLGELCVVEFEGSDESVVREVRRGSRPGVFTLLGWTNEPVEDVVVRSCHRVRALTPGPELSLD